MMPRARIALIACLLLAAVAAAGETPEEESYVPPTRDDIPVRIAEAEVGEWVLYRQANGDRLRLTVTEKWKEKDDTTLVIRSDIIPKNSGRSRVSREEVSVKEAAAEMRTLGEEDRLSRADILVHGRKTPVIVIHYYEDGVLARQSFLSSRIPVYGLVRGVSMKGEKTRVVLSLIDYGYAEDSIE